MQFKALIVVGITILVALPVTARAQVINYLPQLSCQPNKTYDATNHAGAPPLLEKAIASLSGPSAKLGFATCRDDFNNLHYFLRDPRPNQFGVCRQYQQEIFPAANKMVFYRRDDGITDSVDGWTTTVPKTWRKKYYYSAPEGYALPTKGDCPAVSDPRYMPVDHITDGMLRTFDANWHKIVKSREAFDAAFAKLRLTSGNSMGRDISLKEMQNMEIELRIAALEDKIQFTGMSCPEDSDGCTADTNIGIHIGFDFSENGVEFAYLLPTLIP